MRVIFMGNPEFALPTLQALIHSNHEVVGVVSNPPKPMGRGRYLRSTPVGEFSQKNNLNLIEADSLKSPELVEELATLKPDIFVVVAYRILPQSLIDLPNFGAVNLHASLLPKYRGAGPIQWALMNGDETTGVTIFQISRHVDTGAILLQKEMNIEPDDNMMTLGTRLCTEGASLIIKALSGIENKTIKPKHQNHDVATKAPKITKEMTIIDWSWPAIKIHNWIRGLSPHPGMYTTWKGKRCRIFNTRVVDVGVTFGEGLVYRINDEEIFVDTGEHTLAFSEVQLEGKKRLRVSDFMLGNEVQMEDRLGE